jgi:hypothetical protein
MLYLFINLFQCLISVDNQAGCLLKLLRPAFILRRTDSPLGKEQRPQPFLGKLVNHSLGFPQHALVVLTLWVQQLLDHGVSTLGDDLNLVGFLILDHNGHALSLT